jgi:hypothetical protein
MTGDNEKIKILKQEFLKTEKILEKINSFFRNFIDKELTERGKSAASAIVLAEIFADFYTCLETLFLRISRFFENSLEKKKWHKDLLDKMTLEIEDIRIAVISDKTRSLLEEFLKFRHFKRYYFEFEYDWDKLEYLEKKYNKLQPLLNKDFGEFKKFLKNFQN